MNRDNVLKPFPCKETDCGMSFFTEDHLAVHIQAKHTKLNLEIPKTSNAQIFSDQTPTPTRLLNNCEELRVFDDLQNINPFEEGFRRAVEDNSNGLDHSGFLSVPSSNQDTLHTPQILPSSIDPSPTFVGDSTTDSTTTLNNIPKITTTQPSTENITIIDERPPPPIVQQPIALLPKPNIIYAAPILTSTTATIKTESKSSESVKDKLKSVILSNSGVAQNDLNNRLKTHHAIPTIMLTVPLLATPANLVINNNNNSLKDEKKIDVKKHSSDSEISRKRSRTSVDSKGSTQKTERNRAAAQRYRNKMKLQGQAMKEKFDKSQRELQNLRKENSELKKELLHVKSLLLLHKDCPLTKSINIHDTPVLL